MLTSFERYLKETLHLYFTADWNCDTFARVQKLEADLITSRNNRGVTDKEYRALYPLVAHLINEMRDILKKSGQL